MSMFERQNLLLGEDSASRMAEKTIFIAGLGGVGGHLLEALVRLGATEIVAADCDVFEESNLNRQLLCTRDTLGRLKTEAAEKRAAQINPDVRFTGINQRLDSSTIPVLLDRYKPYCIADAVDDKAAKVLLAVEAERRGIKIVSCMGAGNRTDPMSFRAADIYQTTGCPLARTMRKLLKASGVESLRVVYSTELPKPNGGTVGSVSYVPAAAGLLMASEICKFILDI